METLNTNTPEQPLITEDDMPKGRPDLRLVQEPQALIEMPQELQPATEATAPETSETVATTPDAAAGRYGAGVIPVENPGSQAINQAVANGSFPAENVRR